MSKLEPHELPESKSKFSNDSGLYFLQLSKVLFQPKLATTNLELQPPALVISEEKQQQEPTKGPNFSMGTSGPQLEVKHNMFTSTNSNPSHGTSSGSSSDVNMRTTTGVFIIASTVVATEDPEARPVL